MSDMPQIVEIENDKYHYKGEWDHENGYFHGKGELRVYLDDGIFRWYSGDFHEGKRHGHGMECILVPNDLDDISHPLFMRSGFSSNINKVFTVDHYGNRFTSWYTGEWSRGYYHGHGELRNSNTWKFGTWAFGRFRSGDSQIMGKQMGIECWFRLCIEKGMVTKRLCMVPRKDMVNLVSQMAKVTNGCSKRVFYNGYYFRSRLEMRWALFFESLNIDYVYEPRTFHLSNGKRYTPDFWIPRIKAWLEIKANQLYEDEREKAILLHQFVHRRYGHRVFVVYGYCRHPFIKKRERFRKQGGRILEFHPGVDQYTDECCWVKCDQCQRINIGHRNTLPCHTHDEKTLDPHVDIDHAYQVVKSFDVDSYIDTLIPRKKERKKKIVRSRFFANITQS
jgi:hypothetical protein